MGRNDSVAADVLGGIADLAASRLSGAVSDGRDLSRRAAGRSPASSQCVLRDFSALYAAALRKSFVGIVRRTGGRTSAGPGRVSASNLSRGATASATQPSLAGFHAHQLWSGHDGI